MKKIFFYLSLFTFLYANSELEQVLEYEKNGDYERAMKIYKKIALQKSDINKSLSLTKKPTKNEEEENNIFSNIALKNYLGKEQSFNPFGISAYKMNYFLPYSYSFKNLENGNSKYEVKFQLSIKKMLFENLMGLDEKYYFAYTQTSWWQIYKHSSPFRENNYQPEFFIDFPLNFEENHLLNTLRFGLLHESNGQGDAELKSRSWNRIYLSTTLFYDNFIFVPRIWYRIPEPRNNDDNPDIRHYMGAFDINLGYVGKNFFVNSMFRNNLDFSDNKGATQLDFGYDLFDNGVFWYVQYFNGYGESLIDYNRYIQRLSMGLLIAY
ncbi:phospholipase A [Campylobacter sp. LR264d]|uniref:phospholipase A n=1 Tax=Campylobacter sp. LR264d TaxID=2593544 RepID=UPI00123B462E|nr:phospholipase A [Campylobacter sp. LR264d]KAA6230841.1 phospholipase A [Campylobacter sp. LR264d]